MSFIDTSLLFLLLCSSAVQPQNYYGRDDSTSLLFNIPNVINTITLTSYVTITPPTVTNIKTIHDVINTSPITVSQGSTGDYCATTQMTKKAITVTHFATTTVTTTMVNQPFPSDHPCTHDHTMSDNMSNDTGSNNNRTLIKKTARVTVTSLVTNNPLVTAGLLIILGITVFSCCVALCAIKCSQARKNVRRARKLINKWSQHIWREREMNKRIQRNHRSAISRPVNKLPLKTSGDAPTLPNRNVRTEMNDIEMDDLKTLQRQAAKRLGAIPKQTKAIIEQEPNSDSDSPDHPLTKNNDSPDQPTDYPNTTNQTLTNEKTNVDSSNDNEYCVPDNVPNFGGILGGVM